MNDTPPDVAVKYRAWLLERPPADRLTKACGMFDSARQLVIAGIRAECPDISDADLRVRVFERTYGADFTPEERLRLIARLRAYQRVLFDR